MTQSSLLWLVVDVLRHYQLLSKIKGSIPKINDSQSTSSVRIGFDQWPPTHFPEKTPDKRYPVQSDR